MFSYLSIKFSILEILNYIGKEFKKRLIKTFLTLGHNRFCHSKRTKVFNRSYLAQFAAKTFKTW